MEDKWYLDKSLIGIEDEINNINIKLETTNKLLQEIVIQLKQIDGGNFR